MQTLLDDMLLEHATCLPKAPNSLKLHEAAMIARRQHLACLLIAISISYGPRVASAQWALNGVPVCTAANRQVSPKSVPDGAGGAIVTWRDFRAGVVVRVYAQHVLADGTIDPAWPTEGRALCTLCAVDSTGSNPPAIAPDGSGGAIVTWVDYRSGAPPLSNDVYAQRVMADGTIDPGWPADGRALCTAESNQKDPVIVADGVGGAIITWSDYRSGVAGTQWDIYAQHVLASGAVDPGWPVDGRGICTAPNEQVVPAIATDNAGGAIVAWQDYRSGTYDIHAQRVLANGAIDPSWPANGRALCLAIYNQTNPSIVADGAGGAIVSWDDSRNGLEPGNGIYAQHVLASGSVDPAWPVNGQAVCVAARPRYASKIVGDGAGGAIIAWHDARNSTVNYDIYAQHVLSSGAVDPAWPVGGRALCSAIGDQAAPAVVADGSGGAIVVWHDYRSGTTDVYAQHVVASGAVHPDWPADGLALCTAQLSQGSSTIITDGAGGALVAWSDYRDGSMGDLYAQRVSGGGGIVSVPLEPRGQFFIQDPYPNPTGTAVTIGVYLANAQRVSVEVYDVTGKLVCPIAVNQEFPAGFRSVVWHGSGESGVAARAGVYFIRVHAGRAVICRRVVVLP